MANSHSRINIDTLRFILLSFMLVFSPLFSGGNRPLPLLMLELSAVVLLLSLMWQRQWFRQVDRILLWGVGLLLFIPLLYLLQLPVAVYAWLPGRELYADVIALVDSDATWHPLTVIPHVTENSFLTLLVPVAVFSTALTLSPTYLQRLVVLLLCIAAFESILGLIQYGSGADSVFRLGNIHYLDSAVGTYPNRNHLAGFLEMVFPVALGLLSVYCGRKKDIGTSSSKLSELFSSRHLNSAVLIGGVALLIVLAIVFTRSRTGIALLMLAIVLCVIAFSRRLGGRNIFGIMGMFSAVSIGLVMLAGLAPVLQRFATQDPLSDVRWSVFSSTMQGIGQYFPLGSGPGTYSSVYPQFQPINLSSYFVNHAHNDYMEWLFEGGIFAAAVITLFIFLYGLRWRYLWVREEWSTFRFIQIGAGIGILLMLLHSFVDFNLRIPANMVFFAFLAALFFSTKEAALPGNGASGKISRRVSKTHQGDKKLTPMQAEPEKVTNPFKE